MEDMSALRTSLKCKVGMTMTLLAHSTSASWRGEILAGFHPTKITEIPKTIANNKYHNNTSQFPSAS